jgi:hypothetical protein
MQIPASLVPWVSTDLKLSLLLKGNSIFRSQIPRLLVDWAVTVHLGRMADLKGF